MAEATDLPDELKRQVGEAIALMRSELGERYIKRLSEVGQVPQFVTNRAPWTREMLVRSAEAVRAARSLEGYRSLRQRLREGSRAAEGWAVLHLADRFRRAGHVPAFDPRVTVGGREKIPDLRVEWSGERGVSFVEASSLQPSDGQRSAEAASQVLDHAAWKWDVGVSGLVLRTLDDDELREFAARLDAVAEDVAVDGKFRSVEEEESYLVGLSGNAGNLAHAEWAEARGVQVGGRGALIVDDPVARLLRTFNKKKDQLPRDGDHVVALSAPNFPIGYEPGDALIARLESAVAQVPHVAACVLSGATLGGRVDALVAARPHLVLCRTVADVVHETHVIVANTAFPRQWVIELLAATFQA